MKMMPRCAMRQRMSARSGSAVEPMRNAPNPQTLTARHSSAHSRFVRRRRSVKYTSPPITVQEIPLSSPDSENTLIAHVSKLSLRDTLVRLRNAG
jgi:hypothetical protein